MGATPEAALSLKVAALLWTMDETSKPQRWFSLKWKHSLDFDNRVNSLKSFAINRSRVLEFKVPLDPNENRWHKQAVIFKIKQLLIDQKQAETYKQTTTAPQILGSFSNLVVDVDFFCAP